MKLLPCVQHARGFANTSSAISAPAGCVSPADGVVRCENRRDESRRPCNAAGGCHQLVVVDSLTAAPLLPRRDVSGANPPADFERLYRSEVASVAAFFARRSRDPETVADLTAETFLEALRSFASFDPKKGGRRPWVFAIARRVYAKYCEQSARQQTAARREGGRRVLDDEVIEDLAARIDAGRSGRDLLDRLAELSEADREALELVDLTGLSPKEAAMALGVSPGTLRVRLFRARARLRREHRDDV